MRDGHPDLGHSGRESGTVTPPRERQCPSAANDVYFYRVERRYGTEGAR